MSANATPDETEFVGDIDEVLQEDAESFDIRAVPVEVQGPVQVHQVPSVSAGSKNINATTAAVKIANADPRRRSALLMSIDQNMYYGTTQGQCDSSTAALWPKLVTLVVTHQEEIWVRSATSTSVISVVNENWAS